MPLNRENLSAREFIGLKVMIETSRDPTLIGVTGVVRDETKNTFRIETRGKARTVPKRGTSFMVESPSGVRFSLDGRQLAFRPEDRVKRGVRTR